MDDSRHSKRRTGFGYDELMGYAYAHTMDPGLITSLILLVASALLSTNIFFLRGLVKKIDASDMLSTVNSTKLEAVIRQLENNGRDFSDMTKHVSNMDRDVAILKFAIIKKLEGNV